MVAFAWNGFRATKLRGERLLMEELDYNLLFRWFVGLNKDDRLP